MVKTNYANAYKEVLVVLNNLIKEDYNKIPKEYIEFLTVNCNKQHEFYYDTSKTFEQQELLDDAKYILFGLFEKFGSTEFEKEKIKAFKENYYKKLEEEKKLKYTNNIFKDRNNNKQIEIIEYKESLFRKFINRIKKILRI